MLALTQPAKGVPISDVAYGLEHVLGELLRALRVAHRRQHEELVAAEAADRVVRAHRGLQRLRHPHQQRVALAVAEPVVYRLEAVEVDEEQRHRRACSVGERRLDAVHHGAAAQHVRQRVAFDAAAQLLLRDGEVVHVDRHRVQPGDRALGVEVGHVARAHPARALRQRADQARVVHRLAFEARSKWGWCSAQRLAPRTAPM